MQDTLLDLNTMIESTLDEIPDIPSYSNPPPGEYTLDCKDCKVETYNPKAGGEAQRIKIVYAVVTTRSVADGSLPVPDGTMFTETFQASRKGMGYFKARVRAIMNVDSVDGVTLGDMMNGIKGETFDARITIKKTPNPAGGEYENVQIWVVRG